MVHGKPQLMYHGWGVEDLLEHLGCDPIGGHLRVMFWGFLSGQFYVWLCGLFRVYRVFHVPWIFDVFLVFGIGVFKAFSFLGVWSIFGVFGIFVMDIFCQKFLL